MQEKEELRGRCLLGLLVDCYAQTRINGEWFVQLSKSRFLIYLFFLRFSMSRTYRRVATVSRPCPGYTQIFKIKNIYIFWFALGTDLGNVLPVLC